MTLSLRDTLLRELQTPSMGLSNADVVARRQKYGWNRLPSKRRSLLRTFLRQFQSVLVLILLGAAGISVALPLAHGTFDAVELFDAGAILVIVFLNAIFGFFQEWKAENSIAALRELSAPTTKVRRDGVMQDIPSAALVPGDLIQAEAGDRLSADARIIAASGVEVDESSLTGESVPVEKKATASLDASKEGFHPGMLYSGTLVTRGFVEAVVISTGMATEIGAITSLMLTLDQPQTPLQHELTRIGRKVGLGVLVLCAAIFAAGILSGHDARDIFFTVVSLAVAAVPEGLPAISTVCLAIGVQRMARRGALIRKMDAVETLGAVSVICSDKTGTMTENRMTVQDVWVPRGGHRDDALRIAASCNRAELPSVGDPTELGLLREADRCSVTRLTIDVEELSFSSETKYMITRHRDGDRVLRFLKGAPEVIAEFVSQSERTMLLEQSQIFSERGLRVLAVASGEHNRVSLVGLIALMDPPRTNAKSAVLRAARAGIRTIMITGDHPATALSVARDVGIQSERAVSGLEIDRLDDASLLNVVSTVSVFARVRPMHKARILSLLQRRGDVVSMSGDGVNDAPALKSAHVGVAMGRTGTSVAREAASMVLTDDDYSTIVVAIEEGRRIYDNIRKFVLFLMRANAGEIAVIAGAIFLRLPLPLLPLHILWINLVTDSFPALALAMEPAEKSIMQRAPRATSEGIFTGEWSSLVVSAVLTASLVLGVFLVVLGGNDANLPLARSAALAAIIVYQLCLAFSSRDRRSLFAQSFFSNRWLLASCGLSLSLHVGLMLSPLGGVLSIPRLPLTIWGFVFASSFFALLIFELWRYAHHRFVMTKRRV